MERRALHRHASEIRDLMAGKEKFVLVCRAQPSCSKMASSRLNASEFQFSDRRTPGCDRSSSPARLRHEFGPQSGDRVCSPAHPARDENWVPPICQLLLRRVRPVSSNPARPQNELCVCRTGFLVPVQEVPQLQQQSCTPGPCARALGLEEPGEPLSNQRQGYRLFQANANAQAAPTTLFNKAARVVALAAPGNRINRAPSPPP